MKKTWVLAASSCIHFKLTKAAFTWKWETYFCLPLCEIREPLFNKWLRRNKSDTGLGTTRVRCMNTMKNIYKYISHCIMYLCHVGKSLRCWDEQDELCMWTHTHTRFQSSPKMSGLSSMRISPVINVLSLVRMTCSRKSWPKCFSTQAYWTHTHTHMHS